jgi:DNA-binding CsgD family transcriptional regulator
MAQAVLPSVCSHVYDKLGIRSRAALATEYAGRA